MNPAAARRSSPPGPGDERALVRDGRAAGLVAIGYAVILGLWLRENAEPAAAWPMPGWLALGMLFATPAILALVAATRRSATLLVVAGVQCLAQSFISFAGVALPFIAPAVLLVGAGRHGTPAGRPRELLAAALLMLTWLAAWASWLGSVGGEPETTPRSAFLIALATATAIAPLFLLRQRTMRAAS